MFFFQLQLQLAGEGDVLSCDGGAPKDFSAITFLLRLATGLVGSGRIDDDVVVSDRGSVRMRKLFEDPASDGCCLGGCGCGARGGQGEGAGEGFECFSCLAGALVGEVGGFAADGFDEPLGLDP
ncbi:hypothetical protein OG906_40670 (plasmid) [Streptomyces sp. NBC_01426]|uniref:hypothetical protein n=1 Tax=Streptomyces sp. NBC_01426 TaxID=2975866 RepID=UPI002E378424|nr:hypothetical protein [Streptomyces sp. NBC_01426]